MAARSSKVFRLSPTLYPLVSIVHSVREFNVGFACSRQFSSDFFGFFARVTVESMTIARKSDCRHPPVPGANACFDHRLQVRRESNQSLAKASIEQRRAPCLFNLRSVVWLETSSQPFPTKIECRHFRS